MIEMLGGADDFFRDFGQPILEDGTMWDFGFASTGGGGGGWGAPGWPDEQIQVQVSLPSAGGGGGSAPDARPALTEIANAAEAALRQNLQVWQAGTVAADTAIARAWSTLDAMTGQMLRYGQQGYISAAERDRRVDPRYLRWDYIALYIDPIAMGATGAPAAVRPLSSGTLAPAAAGLGGGLSTNQTLLLAGAALAGLILWKTR